MHIPRSCHRCQKFYYDDSGKDYVLNGVNDPHPDSECLTMLREQQKQHRELQKHIDQVAAWVTELETATAESQEGQRDG